jgi:hypothetical protein
MYFQVAHKGYFKGTQVHCFSTKNTWQALFTSQPNPVDCDSPTAADKAAEPDVFAWNIKNYGPEINLFVDHSQIVQIECLRSGIWGTKSLWGRVLTHKE